jgi:hypothetical protein
MSKLPGLTEISQCRTVEALQKALDHAYRQILETAKADWQQLFAGPDPSDASVAVRVSKTEIAEELAGIPRAGFIPVQSKPANGKVRRRLA